MTLIGKSKRNLDAVLFTKITAGFISINLLVYFQFYKQ